ncbi:MAG: HAMP domain-containing histidine kinase [Polyangiaceae bacterium]|nr:HAMP domain-containing histidine kinase [Polyangiaceae bacterium]
MHVSTREDGDALWIEIRDQGPGISPGNIARIWDRFFTTHRDHGGTGLGLAIVKAVVEAHGGRVGVRSEPGHGSLFWVRLPLR